MLYIYVYIYIHNYYILFITVCSFLCYVPQCRLALVWNRRIAGIATLRGAGFAVICWSMWE